MKFDFKSTAKSLVGQWSKPAKGKYVTLKEVAAYSVGGMGIQFIGGVVNYIAMSAGCFLVAFVYGLSPMEMQTIAVISTVVNLVIIPIRGMIIDNLHTKRGKFRPIILWTALPSTVIAVAMAFIPMDASHMTKVVLIAAGFIIMQVFYQNLLFFAYQNLVNVISPNSSERAGIITISSVVYSLAPTITGFMMPMFAEMIGTDLTNIMPYRIAFPIFGVIGILLAFFAYTGTKERIIVPKEFKAKIKFWHGMKSVCSNKYLWIITIQNWFSFARMASSIILNWVFVYQMQDNVAMSLLTTLMGTASLIGMVIAPFLIKIFGKRNVVIVSHIAYGLAYGLTFFTFNSVAAIFVLIYISNIANSTAIITTPTLNADVLDYQQLKTGERLDGFFGNIAIITSVLGIATGYIVPYITESFGLITNYDVLYDPNIRAGLIKALAIVSLIGSGASLVPFLFYDLTEKKHRKIVLELKKRALDADIKGGLITQEDYNNELKLIEEVEAEMEKKDAKREKKKKSLADKFHTKDKNKENNISNTTESDIVNVGEHIDDVTVTTAEDAVEQSEEIDADGTQGGKL